MNWQRCPDLRFSQCRCKYCARLCSCLQADRMAMPCPITVCEDFRQMSPEPVVYDQKAMDADPADEKERIRRELRGKVDAHLAAIYGAGSTAEAPAEKSEARKAAEATLKELEA